MDLTQYTVAIAAPIVEARLGATPLDVSRITTCFKQSFVTVLAQEYILVAWSMIIVHKCAGADIFVHLILKPV